MKNHSNNSNSHNFLSTLIIGATIGAVANYFYRKNENKIHDKASDLKDDIHFKSGEIYGDSKVRVEKILNRLEDMFLKAKDQGKDKIAEIKSDLKDAKEDSKDIARTGYFNAKHAAKDTKDEIDKTTSAY